MNVQKDKNCCVIGCGNRKGVANESGGMPDDGCGEDQNAIKRLFPRTFHRYVFFQQTRPLVCILQKVYL